MSMSSPTKEIEESTSSLSTINPQVSGSESRSFLGALSDIPISPYSVCPGFSCPSTTSTSERVANNRLETDV